MKRHIMKEKRKDDREMITLTIVRKSDVELRLDQNRSLIKSSKASNCSWSETSMQTMSSMTTTQKSGRKRHSSQLATILICSLMLLSIWRLLVLQPISPTHISRSNLMHQPLTPRKSLLSTSRRQTISKKKTRLLPKRLFLQHHKLKQSSMELSKSKKVKKMLQPLAPSKSSASSKFRMERMKTLSLQSVLISPIGTKRQRRKMLRSNSFLTSRPGKLCLIPGSTMPNLKSDYIHNCQVCWHKNNFRYSK